MSIQPIIECGSPALNQFFRQNPDVQLMTFPFNDQTALDQLVWGELDRAEVLRELKAYQRVLQLHPDPHVANALLNKTPQYHSAKAGAAPDVAADSSNPTDGADSTLESAPQATATVFDSAHKITSISRGQFTREVAPLLGEDGAAVAEQIYANATNVRAQTMNMWANIQQLNAPHFQALAVNNTADDILDYYASLPSYEELFGSLNYCECAECKSIFGPAAYFVDLMRIVDQYATKPNADHIPQGMKLNDRRPDLAAIELTCENTNQTMPYLTIVNQRLESVVETVLGSSGDLYLKLAQTFYPFELPFQLPLASIRIYLRRLQVELADIFAALESPANKTAAETLGMSAEEWSLITQSSTDEAKLQTYYGVSDLTQLADAAVLCQQTNLKVTDVYDLLQQDLSADEIAAGLSKQFFINQGLSAPLALDATGEKAVIRNLNNTALDQVHRFLRLARKLGWSYTDLDWALHCVNQGAPVLDESALIGIAAIYKLGQTLNIRADTACQLLFDLKTYGTSVFDQTFNGPGLDTYRPKDADADSYRLNPLYKQAIATWTITARDEANRKLAGRIAAGLGLQLDDLAALASALFGASSTVPLTVAKLSILYRHTRLAGLTRLPIVQYVKLLALSGISIVTPTTADVTVLTDAAERLRRARLNVYELDYVLNAVSSSYVNGFYREEDVDPWLKNLPSLTQSSAREADKRKSEQEDKIRQQLATFFAVKAEQIKSLLALIQQTDIISTFLDESKRSAAHTALRQLSRWLVLVQKFRLANDELDSIQAGLAAYGIQDPNKLTLDNVLDIFTLKELRAQHGDVTGNLLAYMNAADDETAAQQLAELSGQSKAQISQLITLFAGTHNRVKRLGKIIRVLDQIKATGTDASFLLRLRDTCTSSAVDHWADYNKQADALLTAVRARLGGTNWAELYDQINGEVQEQKRTALIRTALNQLAQQPATSWIKNTRNLYEYLLIDVEMGGSTRISYIKEALNAVQLYLIRCRERLEPSISEFAIPEVWWEWLLNYRVWEANRKIFLYPENYIDPAYRNSKTKLFKDLENTLKQGDINAGTVEEAFKKYLDSFAELAKLKYVDASYANISDDHRDDALTLFLIARTETQPYKYYYLTREQDTTWSEWQEMDLTINAETVSLVYVFNRLFVFWVEQKKYDKNTSADTSEKATKATIKYSFYNFSGKWVQPQTLAEDIIIAVEGSAFQTKYSSILKQSLFDPEQLLWHKVDPLTVEKERYWVPGAGANKFEKVILLFGPMLDIDANAAVSGVTSPTSSDATVLEFENRLYRTLLQFNLAKTYNYSGLLPVYPPIVINDDLQVGFLANPNEFLLFAREPANSNIHTRPEIDRSAGRLNLIQTDHLIYDNYYADQIVDPSAVTRPGRLTARSFISTAVGIQDTGSANIYNQLVSAGYAANDGTVGDATNFAEISDFLNKTLQGQPNQAQQVSYCLQVISRAVGTPWLSSAMRNKDYGLFTVKNHPSSFVFKGDKEYILLLDRDDKTKSISRLLYNADTLFSADSFISANVGIERSGSQAIFNLLANAGYLDSFGRLEPISDLDDLTTFLSQQLTKPDQAFAVLNILMHRPMFLANDFIAPPPTDIQAAGSQLIFNQLITTGYLDKNGRLDAEVDFYDLEETVNNLLQGQPNQEKKVRHVVDTLYQRSFPSAVGYFDDSDAAGGLFRFAYDAIRLTTAAVHRLSATLFTGGIDALLSLQSQQIPVEAELPFARFQFAEARVTVPEAIDGAQVDFSGAYGQYYWELFFHAPLYIANLLKTNQQFPEAVKWFQYIFNPTLPLQVIQKDTFQTSTLGVRDSQRIYRVLQDQSIITTDGLVSSTFTKKTNLARYLTFLNADQVNSVRNILLNDQLSRPVARFWQFQPFRNRTLEALKDQLTNANEISAYNNDPFDPHAIARLRNGAYEKAVLMQYIDNLLQWGDSLFAQYTWESIIAATMQYVYAYNLLGERPENLGKCPTPEPVSFADLYRRYGDDIPQFLLDLENEQVQGPVGMNFTPINALDTYFCVPENSNFRAYWDRVEDRLYKIRHGLNLQGIPQPLALFEPPIDPAQLMRAASSGQDVLSSLTQGITEIPYYRFSYLLDRAKNMTSTLMSLGSTILSTLEKKDAEALALLRSTQERQILNLTTLIKEKQIEELKEIIDSLRKSQDSAQARHDHYKALYDENLNALEITDLTLRSSAVVATAAGIPIKGLSIAGYLAPKIFGLANGNMQFGDAVNAGGQIADGTAAVLDQMAALINTGAQYVRRREDWGLQRDQAESEVSQIARQIAANQARQANLQRELDIHLKTMEQAGEYADFLTAKFTNEQLYQWMLGRLATCYFQTYRIALDMAIAAQRAYQLELSRDDQFLQFDYWDSLRKGLLAGEGLMLSLTQMEKAYIENNSRGYEIEKTISLLHLDPVKFIAFKEGLNGTAKGELAFDLTEQLFDFDFPGHYDRKIKSISVTIPAIVGPYQNVSATLTQNSNTIVAKPSIAAVKHLIDPQNPDPQDGSLKRSSPPNQRIALSRGMQDAGLFALDLHDERYLPFEGRGAVSSWTLSLSPATNRFDFTSISDIILKIQYTAQEGGEDFAKDVMSQLYAQQPPYPYTPAKIFDLKQAFPGAWLQLFHTPPQVGSQQISFPVTDAVIMPNLQDVRLQSAAVFLLTPDGKLASDKDSQTHFLSIKLGDGASKPIPINKNFGTVDLSDLTVPSQTCQLSFNLGSTPDVLLTQPGPEREVDPNSLLGMVVVITYQSNVFNKQ